MLAQMIAQSSSVITNALTSGEQLLWSGQPRGGLRLLPSDILALTNERVIIVTTLFGQNRKSLALSEMPDITLSLNGDRSGTITFGEPPPWYSVGGSFFRRTPAAPSLDTIKEAQNVYELIRTAQRAAA